MFIIEHLKCLKNAYKCKYTQKRKLPMANCLFTYCKHRVLKAIVLLLIIEIKYYKIIIVKQIAS